MYAFLIESAPRKYNSIMQPQKKRKEEIGALVTSCAFPPKQLLNEVQHDIVNRKDLILLSKKQQTLYFILHWDIRDWPKALGQSEAR